MISNYSDKDLLNLMIKFLSEGYMEYYIIVKQICGILYYC